MKKEKFEEYLGKEVEITLFNNDIISGKLHKTREEQFKNDANLYLPNNRYFVVKGYGLNGIAKTSCIFRSSHVKKIYTL